MPARIHIQTAGCAFNSSDSEAMAGVLQRAGYEIAASPERADLLVWNTCTVKDKTFNTFRRSLDRFSRGGNSGDRKPLVIAGCIPKAYEASGLLSGYSRIGPDAVGAIDEVVRETLRGKVVARWKSGELESRPALPIHRRNPAVEILPIARGCRSACTFCQTRLARGRLVSFAIAEIVAQARRALDQGVKIFWMTAQDTGAYGHDNDSSLPELLHSVLELPGDFRLRLGMSSPQWIAERLDEILDALAHPKMFKFLHVPLQSGSEKVLRDMRRDGGVPEFERIHSEFFNRFPDGSFVTDIIVGYPTETDDDFEATLNLVRRLELGFINASKFSPRPGTAAAKLNPLPPGIVKARMSRLMKTMREIAERTLMREVGRSVPVIIEQISEDGIRIARNDAFRPIHLTAELPLGASVETKITGTESFHCLGTVEAKSHP